MLGSPCTRVLLVASLLVGVCAVRADAQVAPPRPDSSLGVDSIRQAERRPGGDALDTTRVDSAVAPLPRGEVPPVPAIGPEYRWDREAIFASGAFTLLDLLDRLPEVVGFRSGWLIPPEVATVAGSFGRVRVFIDGIEQDALDPRTGGELDLSLIQLWPMEEVVFERGVDEVRVHLRSWTVTNTAASTRVDVYTGDLNTNMFRGFFGRRFARGEVVQLAAQQFSTRSAVTGGDGDRLALTARLGIARPRWSVDGYFLRTSGNRLPLQRVRELPPLTGQDHERSTAYLRAGWSGPERPGVWGQLIASTQRFEEEFTRPRPAEGDVPAGKDTVLVAASRAQYVATGGFNYAALRVSGAARVRVGDGETFLSPVARVALGRERLLVSGFAERRGEDSTMRADVSARLTPLPFVSLGGGFSVVQPTGGRTGSTVTAARAEGGLRLGQSWLVGGAILSSGRPTGAPIVLDSAFVSVDAGATQGFFAGVRGPIGGGVSADLVATRWNATPSGRLYRPEFEASGRIEHFTRMLDRFPRGNFSIRTAIFGNYMTSVGFLRDATTISTVTSPELNAMLEIRISDAVVSVQYRNLIGTEFETVPGFRMPQPTILYGARWTFRN